MSPLIVLMMSVSVSVGQPAILQKPPVVQPATPPKTEAAEPAPLVEGVSETELRAAGLEISAVRMLELLQRRTAPSPSAEQLEQWIQLLGDKARHGEAAAELVGCGSRAVPILRQTINNANIPEVIERARACLQGIEGSNGVSLTSAAIGILEAKHPSGSTEVLLRYLPFAEEESVVSLIQSALVSIRKSEKKADEALVKALSDPIPIRRAVAATVLARTEGAEAQARLRPLLRDPRAMVRYKVALALVENLDTDTVPILIGLLAELSPTARQEVEEVLTQLAGEWAVSTPKGTDSISRTLKADLWMAWWKRMDGSSLQEEFKRRQVTDAEITTVAGLITSLDDASETVRQQALTKLLAQSPRMLPLLRQATSGRCTPRQLAALGTCVQRLEMDELPRLPATAPHLLALRNPEGTLATLLAYLPLIDDPDMAQKVVDLIAKVGWRGEQPDPILTRALSDPIPLRRETAALVYLRHPDPTHLASVQKLLEDPDMSVRWHIGKALVEHGDRTVMPGLIGLLTQLSLDEAGEVEDFLSVLAGDKSPKAALTAEPMVRTRARDAWLQWWKESGAQVDLARLEPSKSYSNHFLIIENYNPTGRSGSVGEYNRAGKEIWRLQNLMFPTDAQMLPGQRLLVAEQNLNRVSERDLKGKVLWEKQFGQPIFVRRLRNQQTLIGGRNQILLIDANGKDVFTRPVLNETILTVNALPNGHIAYFTFQGTYVLLDRTGKEIKTINIGANVMNANSAEILPGDRVLAGWVNTNRVAEFDAKGKVVWEANVPFPMGVTRLSGGKTLVGSNNGHLIELDAHGKVVAEWKELPLRVSRAYRR